MTKRLILFIGIVFNFPALSQTADKSYTRIRIPLVPTLQSNDIDALNFDQKQVMISYLDGFGRTVQEISQQATNDWGGKDFVKFYNYDCLSKQTRVNLPFASSSDDGSFKHNALVEQNSFYSNASKVAHDPYPFMDNSYELSTLNRLKEKSFAGSNWQMGGGHTIKYEIGFNNSNEIIRWNCIVNSNGIPTGAYRNGFYEENSLYKSKITDENGNQSYEFKDSNGKIICSIVSVYTDANDKTFDFTNGGNTSTGGSIKNYSIYFIYDQFDRISYTLSYEAINRNFSSFTDDYNLSDPNFKDFIFANHYDELNRVIETHIPNKGWESFVYNRLNLLVFSQDAKQKVNNHWAFRKYDALKREIIWGLYNGFESREQLQNNQNILSIDYEERVTSNINGYTNNQFPTTNTEIYGIQYYDNYDFSFDPTLSARLYINYPANQLTVNTSYLLTAAKVKIMGTSDFLCRINYYNDKGDVIQNHIQNYIDYPNSWDVINNERDFSGNLIKSIKTHAAFGNVTEIKSRYHYDHMGRLLDIYKQINSETEIHLLYNEYNELGQLVRKNLHFDYTWPGDYLQNIDYRYNIRGWLSSINNAFLTDDGGITNEDSYDVFGEELYYDNLPSFNASISTIPQFNGNISATRWRSKTFASNVNFKVRPVHQYSYRYDDLNRLTAAYYSHNSDVSPIDFDQETNIFLEKESYDLLGNIQSLDRNARNGTTDELIYTYNNNANQINSISDNISTSTIANDFKDGANQLIEYTYDVNGNIISDQNKGLVTEYNHINLPTSITNTSTGTDVRFIYDAGGNKLCKVYNGNHYYYVNGIEYENSNLQFISTEEGRVRLKNLDSQNIDNYVYDYLIKDHLGNVRVLLTNEILDKKYWATMEDINDPVERELFYNIPNTRDDKPTSMPRDSLYSPDLKTSSLNGQYGTAIGHAKVLEVASGDKISFDTKYFFAGNSVSSTNQNSLPSLLGQLAEIFYPGFLSGTLNSEQLAIAQQTFTQNINLTNYIIASLGDSDSVSLNPKAYLVWLMFDKDFKFIENNSGVLRAENPDQLGTLGILDLEIMTNGYLYVYVSNASSINFDFDNLRIRHVPGFVMEENHYYPFGLLINDISYSVRWRTPRNKIKYNSIELENDLNQNLYGAYYRMLDPVLGRWLQVDPLAVTYKNASPYSSHNNNPVYFQDHYGDEPVTIAIIAAVVIAGAFNVYSHWDMIANSGGTTFESVMSGISYFGAGAAGGAVGVMTAMQGCLTCGMIAGSTVTSIANNVASGGIDPIETSFGVASYNFSNGSFGYIFKPGNTGMQNLMYGLGFITNIIDIRINTRGFPKPSPSEKNPTGPTKPSTGSEQVEKMPSLEIKNIPNEPLKVEVKAMGYVDDLPTQQTLYKVEGADKMQFRALDTDIRPTLNRIENGIPFNHRNDGSIFMNREGILPNQPVGYYKEFVHPTPGTVGPGAQRVVTGLNGEIWFTPDHYRTFLRIE